MNLSTFLYALLAALTGLSLGAGAVEEPRVAERSLAARADVVAAVAGVAVQAARAPLSLISAPPMVLSIDGASWFLPHAPLDVRPARRRE